MHRHQLGAVGEGGFDLDLVDHLGHALHDLGAGQDLGTRGHEFGDGESEREPAGLEPRFGRQRTSPAKSWRYQD